MQSGRTTKWLEQYTFKILGRQEGVEENEDTITQDLVGMYLLRAIAQAVVTANLRGCILKEDRPKFIAFTHHLHTHRGHIPEELRLIGDACTTDVRVHNAARQLHGWAEGLCQLITMEQALRGRDAFQRRYGIILRHPDGIEHAAPAVEAPTPIPVAGETRRPSSVPATATPLPLQ